MSIGRAKGWMPLEKRNFPSPMRLILAIFRLAPYKTFDKKKVRYPRNRTFKEFWIGTYPGACLPGRLFAQGKADRKANNVGICVIIIPA